MKSELTQEKLKRLLDYDPGTGVFTWKEKYSRKVVVGREAGSIRSDNGYRVIRIDGALYFAHRLAWFWMEGYFPKEIYIDHIDKDPLNNQFSNLRLVSNQCNIRNCGNRLDSSSGVKGVSWHKCNQGWAANITVNGKLKFLGVYKDFADAVCARLAGEQCLNWEGCDSSSPAYQYVQKML